MNRRIPSNLTAAVRRNLQVYLNDAFARKVDQTQYSYLGSVYERVVALALAQQFPHQLHELSTVGGAGDSGIDLNGKFTGNYSSLPLLVQCKSSLAKVSGRLWRDLAGTSLLASSTIYKSPALAVLASPAVMTKNAASEFQSIDQPLAFCSVARAEPIWCEESKSLIVYDNSAIVSGFVVNQAGQELLVKAGIDLTLQ